MQKIIPHIGRLLTLAIIGLASMTLVVTKASAQTAAGAPPARAQLRDSFKYYGPGGLWQLWDRDDWQPHRLGRDTWIFWTWGNQKF